MARGSRVEYPDGDPIRRFALFYEKLSAENAEKIMQAAQDGEDTMAEMINTRGTQKTWVRDYGDLPHGVKGRTSSSPGRVATGKMVSDVTSTATVSGKGNVVARFGWLNNKEDYYMYQEGGFNHVQAKTFVEGMYAMQDSKDLVIGNLRRSLKRGS